MQIVQGLANNKFFKCPKKCVFLTFKNKFGISHLYKLQNVEIVSVKMFFFFKSQIHCNRTPSHKNTNFKLIKIYLLNSNTVLREIVNKRVLNSIIFTLADDFTVLMESLPSIMCIMPRSCLDLTSVFF